MGDHAALTGAHGLPLLRSGFGVAQLFFNAVEVLDLQQHPSDLLRCALGCFVELTPRMGPACSQGDASFAAIGERGVGGVTIALHGALKVGGDDSVQTSRCSTGGPGEAHVGSGAFAGPEVTLFGLAVAGAQILHRRFVHLHITACHDSGVDMLVYGFEPVSRQAQPSGHALAWDGDLVPAGIDLLLPVERQMIAILRDDDLSE